MTTIQLYNAFNKKIEPVELTDEQVTVYVCGITPYDTTHLGHAFTYTVADHLMRFLEFLGHRVNYVQNVTDIDDDILRKADEVKEDWRALGNRWTRHFLQDLQRLNVRPPEHYPRASDFIPQMVQGIQRLVEKGLAYVADGSVYYRAHAWPAFGRLSGLEADELLPTANERGNQADDPAKADPLDFPLWQAQKPGEPGWESPWGQGRPGWHIECSTMATALLGDTVDFHGGGSDLAFPHHECEIAQAEPVTGVSPFVRRWFHAGMVEFEGEKMSKSLGNLVMVRDLLEEFSANALRLYLAAQHYREPWSYRRQDLEDAAQQVADWQKIAAETGPVSEPTNVTGEQATDTVADTAANTDSSLSAVYRTRFNTALAQDLDTPQAVAVLADMAQKILQAAQAGNDIEENTEAARATFVSLASVLGLRLLSPMPQSAVIQGWNRHMKQFS